MQQEDFPHAYARQRQALGVMYEATEFLYPHNEPWPETSFDYPYGQAPTVSNIPPEEETDWNTSIGQYYVDNAVGTSKHPSPFGFKGAEFARDAFEKNGITGYAPLSDEDFLRLVCEGLYSKYLSPLDPQDEALFGVKDSADYQYLKSDQSCMKVVTKPWEGEYVAPSITIVRRALPLPEGEDKFNYELVAIALAGKNGEGEYEYREDLIFDAKTHESHSAWWLAKYYVLQGAINRINLIDHVKVHFPGDTINAITKSVLPKWHLLQQLLLPHFRLTLPVNNAVLEGDRSLINRNSWYPWNPFTARGEEIRKLFPFSWAGSRYYWDQPNSSYPRYSFSIDPDHVVDPDDPDRGPIPTFIGMEASRYGEFLKDYYAPVLEYTTAVIDQLPEPPSGADDADLNWLEIQRWAHEVAKLMPGFPDETQINDKALLSRVCATIIWNAAVVHSSDHCTLHTMVDKYPVPFILRVRPPQSNDAEVEETVGEALGEKGVKYLKGALGGLEHLLDHVLQDVPFGGTIAKALDSVADKLEEHIINMELREGSVPLCWPTDLTFAKMADLLFYRPHSTTLLYDCDYEFLIPENDLSKEQKETQEAWKADGRPLLTATQRGQLAQARAQFQQHLSQINSKYYDAQGKPVLYKEENPDYHPTDIPCVLNTYGFPKLIPGSEDTKAEETRVECCFTAGIQY